MLWLARRDKIVVYLPGVKLNVRQSDAFQHLAHILLRPIAMEEEASFSTAAARGEEVAPAAQDARHFHYRSAIRGEKLERFQANDKVEVLCGKGKRYGRMMVERYS